MTARDQPERVLVGLLGLLLFVYGITGLLLTEATFSGNPVDGTVNGETWLGIEGNGWTFLLFVTAGVLLFAGSAARAAAKATAIVTGLLLGAASVIALVDGDDVLGALAANGPTKLAWGIGALILLAIGLAPSGRREDEASWTIPDENRTPAAARFRRSEAGETAGRRRH